MKSKVRSAPQLPILVDKLGPEPFNNGLYHYDDQYFRDLLPSFNTMNLYKASTNLYEKHPLNRWFSVKKNRRFYLQVYF